MATVERLNPYVGPRTFHEKDGRFFFGREREARDLLSLVITEPLVLFYGQSGAGKSSLINARLIPGLRAERFAVLPIGRIGGALPQGVESAGNIFVFNLLLSLDQGRADPANLAHLSLSDYLNANAEALAPSPPGDEEDDLFDATARVLIIDQFEEIITTNPERWQEREPFFQQLGQSLKNDAYLWVVLSVREDYVAALSPYARLLPGKLRARSYLQRLGVAAALEAVEKPAAEAGRPFAPGVAQSLIDNLRQIHGFQNGEDVYLGQYVEPVQLQVVCYQLWQNLQDRPQQPITAQDLAEVGDVDTALAQFYEQALAAAIAQTGVSEMELRHWVERRLITEAGTRGTAYQGLQETAGMDNRVVYLLAAQFLLRAEIRAGGAWYELVHDRFIAPILQANQQWRLRQSPLVQAAEAWDRAGRPAEKLYRDHQLQQALAGGALENAGRLVQDFLMTSQEAQSQRDLVMEQARAAEQAQRAAAEARAAQRLRRLANVLLLAVLFALVATGLAFFQERRALADQIQAEQDALNAITQRRAADAASTRAAVQESTADYASDYARQQQGLADQESAFARTQEAIAVAEATRAADEAVAAVTAAAQAVAQRATADAAGTRAVEQAAIAVIARADADLQASLLQLQSLIFTALDLSNQGSDDELALLLALEASHINNQVGGDFDALISQALAPVLTREYFSLILPGEGSIADLAFSPDGRLLASAGSNGLRLYRLDDPAIPATLLPGHQGTVNAVRFTADGQTLISAGEDATIRLWSVPSLAGPGGAAEPRILNDAGPVRAIDVDRGRLVSSLAGGAVNLWTLADAQPAPTPVFVQGQAAFRPAAFHRTQTFVMVGNTNGALQSWPLFNLYASPQTFQWQPEAINLLIAYPGGRAYAAVNGVIRVERDGLDVDLIGHSGLVNSLSISADGQTIASAGSDGAVRIWDMPHRDDRTTPARVVLSGHLGAVTAVAFAPDDQWLASAGADGDIRLWRLIPPRTPLAGIGPRFLFAPDGTLASIVGEPTNREIRLHSPGDLAATPALLPQGNGPLGALAFSPDSRVLAAGYNTFDVRLWPLGGSQPAAPVYHWLQHGVTAVAYSPDGWLAVAGSANGDIALYRSTAAGAFPETLSGHSAVVTALAFSADGRWLVSATAPGSRNHTTRLWPVGDSVALTPVTLAEQGANALVFSPDGRMLAAAGGSAAGALHLWQWPDPAAPVVYSGPVPFTQVAFSPDGQTLAATAQGVYLWRVGSPATPVIFPYPGVLTALAFAPDGRQLLVGGDIGSELWPTLDALPDTVCRHIHRNLTQAEWQRYVVTGAYRPTCPNLP